MGSITKSYQKYSARSVAGQLKNAKIKIKALRFENNKLKGELKKLQDGRTYKILMQKIRDSELKLKNLKARYEVLKHRFEVVMKQRDQLKKKIQ